MLSGVEAFTIHSSLSLVRGTTKQKDVAYDCGFGVGGVAFKNGTSPPSPLLKERGDSLIVDWGLAVLSLMIAPHPRPLSNLIRPSGTFSLK